jgi:hypothetical protein
MNQHIAEAAALLGVTIALATGCSSKDTGITLRPVSPVRTTQQNSDPQGDGGCQSLRCPGFEDLFGS